MLRKRPHDDGAVELDVQAVPRSSRDEVGKPHGDRLELYIRAPPVDGEANEAIVRLLADVLELPRQAITLARGQTGKRKTVRIVGLELDAVRRALGLAVLAVLTTSACESSRELGVAVVLPDESDEYERANNATLVLQPGSEAVQFAVDGLDFSLEVEREPDTTPRRLELYLAEDDELLAWGSTAQFTLDGPSADLALFLGRPGRLSTWPAKVADPDSELLACRAVGRGMVLLESDGDTSLLNEFTLGLEPGAELDVELISASDGGLFSASDGTVVRMTWEQGPAAAWRYDPGEDRWDPLEVDAASTIGPRPAAATLVEPDLGRVYLLGGGDHADAVAIELSADDDGQLGSAPVTDFILDGPRPGAVALWLASEDSPSADALLVGGSDPSLPIAWLASSGASFGPAHAWVDMACTVRLAASETEPLTVLCLGGLLDGQPSTSAMHASFGEGAPSIEFVESFLPIALADPMVLGDEIAVYALGEGRWFPIDRATALVENSDFTTLLARGGHSVLLSSGATFVVGGVGTDDTALDRWQVFMPALTP